MQDQIERIKNKLAQLREQDPEFKIFGADVHQYLLNPVLTADEVEKFQTENNVALPEEYVAFITSIGNGGAGPFYGVRTLHESTINIFDDSEKQDHTYFDLSKPFPHTSHWNVDDELDELYEKIEAAAEAGDVQLEEELFEQKWKIIGGEEHDFGRLNTTDYGCGVEITLVVNGKEKGNMWTDDRANDGGIYPSTELGNTERINFLDWYERWLDNSLEEIKNKQ